MPRARPTDAIARQQWFESDPLWFKTAVFYEIHVRGFFDGNGDGSGDFRGLTEKLDYLEWLGIDCIWLLPMYPSPLARRRLRHLRLHGRAPRLRHGRRRRRVHRRRAPARDPRDRRPRDEPHLERPRLVSGGALVAPTRPSATGTSGRTTDDRYRDARIIFVDTETSNWTWDEQAGAYYWHRFFHHQPDLNYDEPAGAGGDARRAALLARPRPRRLPPRRGPVPVRARGHQLREPAGDARVPGAVRATIDAEYPDRVLLAEANQWPADVVEYFGDGRRVPHGVPLPGDAAHVHGAAPRAARRRSSRSSSRRRRSRTTRSGGSSCATTTS